MQLERVKLIYTIPEHANPTGISLAAVATAAPGRAGKKMVEDSSYFRTGGRRVPWSGVRGTGAAVAVEPRSAGDTVILARTFSKTLSPGLKIGYGVLPESLVDPILALKGNHDFGSANFNQQVARADPLRRKLRALTLAS